MDEQAELEYDNNVEINFLEPLQVIEIQSSTLPNSGDPHLDKLEGALYRVHCLHFYENCNDIFILAAQYLIAIAKAHAFNDANKRTAFQSASIFLLMNGYELGTSEELVKLTIFAASDDASLIEAAFALRLLSDYGDELLDDYPDDYVEP